MLRVRRLEETCVELYSAAKIRGFLHVYIGEEAVAAGVMNALARTTPSSPPTGSTATPCSAGSPPERSSPRCTASVEGCCRGRGGSMHLFDAATRFYGGNAIVAGGLPLAVGLALADKMQGRDRVTVCFFGEGAVAEGEFHESLNLAALWQLPVLFCCENNLYAMGTALRRSESQTDIALKAAGYEIAAWAVDGMDVLAVEETARRAVDAVRSGGGPHFLELRTYRFRAHSMFDPERYRDKAEVARWLERDPITLLRAAMEAAGQLSDAGLGRSSSRRSTRRWRRRGLRRSRNPRAGGGPHPLRLQRARRPARRHEDPATARRCAPAIRDAMQPRRAGLPDGRGRRALRRMLRREPGAAGGVRPGADPRHAAVGVRFRRRRHRGGPRRDAPDRRDHDRQFQPAGPGPDREQRGDACCTCPAGNSTCRS